jgi:hypothetical protein
MKFWIAALGAAAGIVAFFSWTNRQAAKAHARFTSKDAEMALSELLDPEAPTHDTSDLFLAWPIDDSHLESIRLECLRICHECPPVPGKDINEEGEKRVAALLADLRRRNRPSNGPTAAPSTSQ